ncbi:peptide deformylase [Acinetobacter indicus]|nr:peptide deformylase [Acinetobacter indicus]
MAWAQQSKLRYFTLAGSKVMWVFHDFPAQIVQHTIDHLHRSLWIDRP